MRDWAESQGYQFVVNKVRRFGRVELEYAVDRTGNRNCYAGRASFQATGGVNAVGRGLREDCHLVLQIKDKRVVESITNTLTCENPGVKFFQSPNLWIGVAGINILGDTEVVVAGAFEEVGAHIAIVDFRHRSN